MHFQIEIHKKLLIALVLAGHRSQTQLQIFAKSADLKANQADFLLCIQLANLRHSTLSKLRWRANSFYLLSKQLSNLLPPQLLISPISFAPVLFVSALPVVDFPCRHMEEQGGVLSLHRAFHRGNVGRQWAPGTDYTSLKVGMCEAMILQHQFI